MQESADSTSLAPSHIGAKAARPDAATRGRTGAGGSPRAPGTPSAGGIPPAPGCGPAARVSSSADPAGRRRQRPGSSRGTDAAPPSCGRRREKQSRAPPPPTPHPQPLRSQSQVCSFSGSPPPPGTRCAAPRPHLRSSLPVRAPPPHPLPHPALPEAVPGSSGQGPRAGWAARISAGSPPRPGRAAPSAWRRPG